MTTRRTLILSAAALASWTVFGQLAQAAATELKWGDLIPGGGPAATPEDLQPHEENGQLVMPDVNALPAPTRADLDGQEVSIRGYLVPIGYKQGSNGQSIAGFLLAPFVGACVHVPPPPSNQIILGNYPEGLEMSSRIWFDPVTVVGTLKVTPLDTGLARVGYQIEAQSVSF